MGWVSGRFKCCPTCGDDRVPVVAGSEWMDAIDRIWTGEQRCEACGAALLYSRRAETQEEKDMARRGGQKSGDAHAVNKILDAAAANHGEIVEDFLPADITIVSQTDVEAVDAGSIGGTPIEQAAATLGPERLPPMDAPPPADVARRQFEELGTCYEAVERAQSHFDAKSKAAKAAKADLEDVTTTLLSVVRRMTTPPVLPLFDGVQAEQDLVALQTAATAALDGVAVGESPVDDAREAIDEMFPSEESSAS